MKKMTRKQLRKLIKNSLFENRNNTQHNIFEVSLKRKVRSYTLADYKSEDFKNDILEYIDSGLSPSYERVFSEWRDKVLGTFSEADTERFINNLREWTRGGIEATFTDWSMQDIMAAFFKDVVI